MTQSNEPVAVLRSALDQLADVLSAISDDQLSDPTPCEDWDVAQLIGHVLADTPRFLEALQGGEPDWAALPEPASGNWTSTFRADADDLVAAWERADPQEGATDWQLAEYAVHTWDLVRATKQERELDPVVAERGYAFMAANLTPENRGGAFRPAVEVSHDADPYDRIAAFAGRRVPNWG